MKKLYLVVGILLLIYLLGIGIYIYIVSQTQGPEITIQGVNSGMTYPHGAVLRPQVVVKGLAPRYRVWLNGIRYHGELISKPDLYILKVEATDFWGRRSTKVISFAIDTKNMEDIFGFSPISIKFHRTPAGNTLLKLFVYIQKKKINFSKTICGSSLTIHYENHGWGLIPIRTWKVLSRKKNLHLGWLTEYAYIFASEPTEQLRRAVQQNSQKVLFRMTVLYGSPEDCSNAQSDLAAWWLDQMPLRFDRKLAHSFYRENRLVLQSGHPTIDPLCDEPASPMVYKLP